MTVAPWIIAAHKSGEWVDTRGGDRHRVICIDAPGPYPVISMDELGSWQNHNADGSTPSHGRHDLIPPRREWEVCMYGDDAGCVIVRFDYEPRPPFYKLLARAKVREGDV